MSRYFTKFKVLQKHDNQNGVYFQDLFLSSQSNIKSNDIDLLIKKGLGHARKVIDEQLASKLSVIWVLLFVIMVALSLLKIFQVIPAI